MGQAELRLHGVLKSWRRGYLSNYVLSVKRDERVALCGDPLRSARISADYYGVCFEVALNRRLFWLIRSSKEDLSFTRGLSHIGEMAPNTKVASKYNQ